MSERIRILEEVWKEFENQAVIKIKDMRKLSDTFSKAQMQIERLEDSRDNWKKKYEKLNKYIKENSLTKE